MTLTFERGYPWIAGGAAALAAWLLDWRLPGDPALFSLLSAAISVSAILVGFLATMKSILMAMPSVLVRVREAEYLDDLTSYLAAAIAGNMLFCCLSLSAFFPWAIANGQILAVTWFGLAIFSGLAFWRVTHIMTALLRWTP